MHIFHITERSTWQKAKHGNLYEGDTLSVDGFIHCCLFEQIEGVLLNWFKGKRGLVILEIDPEILLSPIECKSNRGLARLDRIFLKCHHCTVKGYRATR